jgi:hypothetical protein
MYDTRPSEHTGEIVRGTLEDGAQNIDLNEHEQAAKKIFIAFLERPGWKMQIDDTKVSIVDHINQELGEELELDKKSLKEGVGLLLKDKLLVLGRSQDRKQHQPPNIVGARLPAYMTAEVVELALNSRKRKENVNEFS